MIFLISYGLVIIAVFFNAIMDAVENTPNFNESIFKNLDKKFWCKDVSWQYAKKIFNYKLDAWHLSKSAMIICLAMAIVFFRPKHNWWVHLISIGLIWNMGFWFFYHKVFKVK